MTLRDAILCAASPVYPECLGEGRQAFPPPLSRYLRKTNGGSAGLQAREKRWRAALSDALPDPQQLLAFQLRQSSQRRQTGPWPEKLIQAAKFSLSTSPLSDLGATHVSTPARRLNLSRVSTSALLFTQTAHRAVKQLLARSFGQIVAFARAKYPPHAAAASRGKQWPRMQRRSPVCTATWKRVFGRQCS